MSERSVKLAISLPDFIFQRIERIRQKEDTSRSAIILEAIESWLQMRRREELIRRYERGYRRKPEGKEEVECFERAAAPILSEEEWK